MKPTTFAFSITISKNDILTEKYNLNKSPFYSYIQLLNADGS